MGSFRILIAFVIMAALADSAFARQGTTKTDLNLHAGPAANTELLLTIPAGSRVELGACSRYWCKVTWNSYSGYARQSGIAVAYAAPRSTVRRPAVAQDELWPIYPPYPYRAGHYPKADWYHAMPPYVAIAPSFYRRRFFMMAQERNRYRYMPHIFRGSGADYGIDHGPDVDFDYEIPSLADIERATSTNGDKPNP